MHKLPSVKDVFHTHTRCKRGRLAIKKNNPRSTEVSNLNPIAAVSFLWNGVEQKDLAESETGVSVKPKGFASKKINLNTNSNLVNLAKIFAV